MKRFLSTSGKDKVKGGSSNVDSLNGISFLKKCPAAIDKSSTDGTPAVNFDCTARPQGDGIDIDALKYYLNMIRGDEQ